MNYGFKSQGYPPVLIFGIAETNGIIEVKPLIDPFIQSFVEEKQYSVVREYCGHGIGRVFHEDPQVLHYGRPGEGAVLRVAAVRREAWTIPGTASCLMRNSGTQKE